MAGTDFRVVLDACVLSNFGVCDLLLRLAETPRLLLPRWSARILEETHRTQTEKLGWAREMSDGFRGALAEAFPEALVEGYEFIEPRCKNDSGDRHVLACAIHCKAGIVVTFNTRDFGKEALAEWDIEAMHPQDFLLALYSMSPALVMRRLGDIAHKRGKSTQDLG